MSRQIGSSYFFFFEECLAPTLTDKDIEVHSMSGNLLQHQVISHAVLSIALVMMSVKQNGVEFSNFSGPPPPSEFGKFPIYFV